jgi:cyclopropane fatty-acyl-phospholipid synthase-like methyltransferase
LRETNSLVRDKPERQEENSMSNSIYNDGTYLEKNPTWHEEDSAWKAKQISRILGANNVNPSTLCEIGCGAGEILNCLSHEHGERVVFSGYEISPQAFAICKNKEKNNLHFSLENLLDCEDASFDVVMAIDVFEHVEDYFGFLRKLRKKGIYKIFHIPLDLSVQSVFRSSRILQFRSSVGHIHYFTKETAIATLQDTGYEVVDYFYTNGSLELSNLGWKANLMKLPRKLFFHLNSDAAVRVLGGFSLLVLAK